MHVVYVRKSTFIGRCMILDIFFLIFQNFSGSFNFVLFKNLLLYVCPWKRHILKFMTLRQGFLKFFEAFWLPNGFGKPKCVCRQVKFPKYVCLVTQLGKQLLEKQILKIILDII